MPLPQIRYLGLFGNRVALYLEHFHRGHKVVSLERVNIAYVLSVDHYWVAVSVLDVVIIFERDHSVLDTDILQVVMCLLVEGFVGQRAAADRDVVQQAARAAIGCVHWAQEAPTLREQFSDRGGLHLCEISTPVN